MRKIDVFKANPKRCRASLATVLQIVVATAIIVLKISQAF
jgi:hypothetical protein